LPATSTKLIRQSQPYSLSTCISSLDPHPVEHAIPMHLQQRITDIVALTSVNPNAPISSFDNTLIHQITRQSFHNLIMHGSPIDDSIIHSYLCFLSDTHPNIKFLDSNFHREFARHGWDHAFRKYFLHETSYRYSKKLHLKPLVNSPIIIIPIHLNQSHWVILTRRVIGDSTYFLYADDLNSTNNEDTVRNLYSTKSTSQFYPHSAIWVHCTSYTYHPHSNECGPRSLLAATIMFLHPNPSRDIILPYMHPNISEISQWWVAYSILSRSIDSFPFTRSFDSLHDVGNVPSVHMTSSPYDLCLPPITNDTHFNVESVIPTKSNMGKNISLPASLDVTGEWIHSAPPTNFHSIPSKDPIADPIMAHPSLPYKSQQSIDKWLVHRPFIPSISFDASNHVPGHPSTQSQIFLDHLTPFGNPITVVDQTKILRVCMQNTQHDFRLYGDGIKITSISNQLKTLGVNMFIPISPNVNWQNPSNWARTRQCFRSNFLQVSVSAVSSNMGLDPLYLHKSLVGGAAILTFGLWSAKVSNTFHDESRFGSYTVTTIQGKGKKYVSFVAAYIAVKKGSDIGTESLYAQQMTIHEQNTLQQGSNTTLSYCPQKNAILRIYDIILALQKQNHAVVLMLDANQSYAECFRGSRVRPYSIEWLRLQRGMDDPFISLMQARPNSTTFTPMRDIDYILTYGIKAEIISTLEPNSPAHSDHLGIVINFDLSSHFSSTFSDINNTSPRLLTSGNNSTVSKYIEYVTDQVIHHKLDTKIDQLLSKIHNNPTILSIEDHAELNMIDSMLTDIMLAGERHSSSKRIQRQHWSPKQHMIARTFSYWKQKANMETKKIFNWTHLERLRSHTLISDTEHSINDPIFIKKGGGMQQMEFLQETI
jgi:hypothetical protein